MRKVVSVTNITKRGSNIEPQPGLYGSSKSGALTPSRLRLVAQPAEDLTLDDGVERHQRLPVAVPGGLRIEAFREELSRAIAPPDQIRKVSPQDKAGHPRNTAQAVPSTGCLSLLRDQPARRLSFMPPGPDHREP